MVVGNRKAAEITFILAIPTMAGAFALDAWESRNSIDMEHVGIIAVGFVVSFLVAIFVIRWMLDVVTKRGFALFSWWRIVVGAAGLAWLQRDCRISATSCCGGRARSRLKPVSSGCNGSRSRS